MSKPILTHMMTLTTGHPGYGIFTPFGWPAPDPDDVVIEEEFDHYRVYLQPQWECTTHNLQEALGVYNTHTKAHTPEGGYPLKSLWQTAREALATLNTEAQRLDQDWSELPARELNDVMGYFNECHTQWVAEAREDGRTW
jgi:hypothetical protein